MKYILPYKSKRMLNIMLKNKVTGEIDDVLMTVYTLEEEELNKLDQAFENGDVTSILVINGNNKKLLISDPSKGTLIGHGQEDGICTLTYIDAGNSEKLDLFINIMS